MECLYKGTIPICIQYTLYCLPYSGYALNRTKPVKLSKICSLSQWLLELHIIGKPWRGCIIKITSFEWVCITWAQNVLRDDMHQDSIHTVH